MDTSKKLEVTKEHWENPQVVSLKDANLRSIEINSITSALKKHAAGREWSSLADFGCGDGFDTQQYSKLAKKTVGFDYSSEMLSRASKLQGDTLKFQKLDLISGDVFGTYDAVVTKRFVINLGDWAIQSKCLKKIAGAIEPGGIFCLLECYRSGLENVNSHRVKAGLPPLVEPYHNTYMDFDKVLGLMSGDFSVVETRDFSTYFYLTRCVAPFVMGENAFDFDEKMRLLAESDDVLQGSGIGPQRLVCFKRK
ncbi:MAG: class I SAM-dependent methyltransferase [Nitrospinae bacterium]|nr:class I SAM-dependent methyltransferase [Nitrospinota bacterium]